MVANGAAAAMAMTTITATETATTILSLPNEVLLHVFEYLDLHDLSAAACVCAHWSYVALDRTLNAGAGLEIYREREMSDPIVIEYLTQHTSLCANMRSVLIDWLQEVARSRELPTETVALTARIFDVFMTKSAQAGELVERGSLQMIGVACLWLAAKTSHVYHAVPNASDLVALSDHAFTV
jgi:hypothetical protein